MTVIIDSSDDLTLDTITRIAWNHERCILSDRAITRIARRREEFLVFVEKNTDRHLYGITTKHHVGAKSVLGVEGRTEFATRLPSTPASIGAALPERVVRATILARLADVLNGTACLRVETVHRLLHMLDTELPPVPARGNGEPGDIIPLGHLFRAHFDGTLEIGEGMALINVFPGRRGRPRRRHPRRPPPSHRDRTCNGTGRRGDQCPPQPLCRRTRSRLA